MKKDYLVTISENKRDLSWNERRFVARAKNALLAEKHVLEIIAELNEKQKDKTWVFFDIKRI